jgi:type VI secretion system protein ImpA
MAGGKEKIAQALLDELAAEIEARRLDDWEETEAVAYPLSLLLRCLAADGADNERRTQLYARICKLDPIRALNCSP